MRLIPKRKGYYKPKESVLQPAIIKEYHLSDSVDDHVETLTGAMVTGNTETFITVTYQSSDATLDFVVPVKDENDMASNSDTFLATQQSIKAYVDTYSVLVADLEDTPTENEADKATTSEYIFDHVADVTAHNALIWAIVFGG